MSRETVLCDVNIWFTLTVAEHVQHRTVLRWFDQVTDAASVLFCRATEQSFLRLLTTRAVMHGVQRDPLTNAQAWAVLEALRGDDRVQSLTTEPAGLEQYWAEYAARSPSSPKLWMDAYLAAFARAGGHGLVTTDGAFTQFAGLNARVLG